MLTTSAGVRFRFNPACLREIQQLRETGDAMEVRGREIVDGALTYAPRDTGAYVSSLYASKEHTGRGWVGYANAEVPYAWFVEYGSESWHRDGGYAPLRSAAEQIGRVR